MKTVKPKKPQVIITQTLSKTPLLNGVARPKQKQSAVRGPSAQKNKMGAF
jgi:hypothetical protein